jgi:photosystem II stability/assembly factor-like uncharacterized protein
MTAVALTGVSSACTFYTACPTGNQPAPPDTGGANAQGGSSAGGSSGSGGSSVGLAGAAGDGDMPSDAWEEVTPPIETEGCSGVAINRLTGDVFADVTKHGIWKSVNQGGDWDRVDNDTVGGLLVWGSAFDVDQDDPTRMAVWSLDGLPGWTADGVEWRTMAQVDRNWDFGSTDWATPDPKTMIVTRHEVPEVYLSTDGAESWDLLSIKAVASGGGATPFAMVGVMDETTLIYGNGQGILRSTDLGKSFDKVSNFNARTRVPVLFNGVFYLGADGLIVSKDKGATWERQGASLEIWVGPYFGKDDSEIMVGNKQGVYLSSDAGETWQHVATLPHDNDNRYDPQGFGGFAWDPQGGILYASGLGKPLLKLTL